MPLNTNPFFLPVMESIDMLAADNARQQGEQRREDRQIEREDRQAEREDEVHQRGVQEGEMGDLTKFITEYEQNVKAGAEPDPDLLNSVVEKRNALIQEGVYPSMMGISAPEAPKPGKEGKAGKPGDDLVNLDPATARKYKYFDKEGNQIKVKRETKRILEQAMHKKETTGTGTGAESDDPLKIIGQMRKRSQQVWDKGVLGKGQDWREGIGQDMLNEYQSDLQQIEQDFRAGLLSKAEARMKAVQLGTFDQFLALHGADRDQSTQEGAEIKEALIKMAED